MNWRVNFSRVEWRAEVRDGEYRKTPNPDTGRPYPEDNWVWSPQGIIDLHRPEKWGYVQFTRKSSRKVAFVPDPAAEVRNRLQEIYYAQRSYKGKNGYWAKSLVELDLSVNPKTINPPELKITPGGFEATVELKLPRKKPQRWHIREDARIWPD